MSHVVMLQCGCGWKIQGTSEEYVRKRPNRRGERERTEKTTGEKEQGGGVQLKAIDKLFEE